MESHERQFLDLYQTYRYDHQFGFYKSRVNEFKNARTQARWLGGGLTFLAGLASLGASYSVPPLRLILLIIAAICLIFYTALAAYIALFAFDQQAKLYQDTIYALEDAHTTSPDPVSQDFAEQLGKYVDEVEKIFLVEQGQWGQLAGEMKPPEV